MNSPTVGLIGIGRLGSAIASRLLSAGFAVHGWDSSAEARAAFVAAGGVEQNPVRGERVVLCLPSHDVARTVALSLAEAKLVVDVTNATPEESRALAAELAARGVHYLDAPCAEWCGHVRERGGRILCGGDVADVEACRDLFDAFANPLVHAGGNGEGSRAKQEFDREHR